MARLDQPTRLLLFEPYGAQRQALSTRLAREGLQVRWCRRSDEAEASLASVDAAVVSVSSVIGLRLLEHIRCTVPELPVLVASRAEETEARLLGLDRGAVDFLIRPLDPRELAIRVFTALYRQRAVLSAGATGSGGLPDQPGSRHGLHRTDAAMNSLSRDTIVSTGAP